jgi:adenylate kinase family enzyme
VTSCAKKSAKSLKEALGLTSALKKASSVSHVTVSIWIFLVDDELVIQIVKEQIEHTEKVKKSWIITGFPRTKV